MSKKVLFAIVTLSAMLDFNKAHAMEDRTKQYLDCVEMIFKPMGKCIDNCDVEYKDKFEERKACGKKCNERGKEQYNKACKPILPKGWSPLWE